MSVHVLTFPVGPHRGWQAIDREAVEVVRRYTAQSPAEARATLDQSGTIELERDPSSGSWSGVCRVTV